MGFFTKIKDNFTHGGVKVQLQAPASASMNDASIPAAITVSATDKQETIENVSLFLVARNSNRGFVQPGNISNTPNQATETVVAQANYMQPFTIAPGENKTVELAITMNQGAAMQSQMPSDGALAQVAGMMQQLQSVSEIMNDTSYEYRIRATAKVEGIAFSPSHELPIQLLKPGEVGGALRL